MYFVEASEYTTWENNVRTTMASDAYNELIDGIYEDIEENAEKTEKVLDFFADRLQKSISSRY
jgi:hypothetical protein